MSKNKGVLSTEVTGKAIMSELYFDDPADLVTGAMSNGIVSIDKDTNIKNKVIVFVSTGISKDALSKLKPLQLFGCSIQLHEEIEWVKQGRASLGSIEKANSLGVKPEDYEEFKSIVEHGEIFKDLIGKFQASGKMHQKTWGKTEKKMISLGYGTWINNFIPEPPATESNPPSEVTEETQPDSTD